MKEILKKVIKEVVRVGLAALLAALGLETSGCLAVGDGATSSVAFPAGNN